VDLSGWSQQKAVATANVTMEQMPQIVCFGTAGLSIMDSSVIASIENLRLGGMLL